MDHQRGDSLHILEPVGVKVHQELPDPRPHGCEGQLQRHTLAWSDATTEGEKTQTQT